MAEILPIRRKKKTINQSVTNDIQVTDRLKS